MSSCKPRGSHMLPVGEQASSNTFRYLVNLDAARFIRFRDDALKIDIQQAIHQIRAFYMDVFSELEFALKVALGNALVQIGAFFLLGSVCAFHDQQIVLGGDFQFAFCETGNRDRDAIVISVI